MNAREAAGGARDSRTKDGPRFASTNTDESVFRDNVVGGPSCSSTKPSGTARSTLRWTLRDSAMRSLSDTGQVLYGT